MKASRKKERIDGMVARGEGGDEPNLQSAKRREEGRANNNAYRLRRGCFCGIRSLHMD